MTTQISDTSNETAVRALLDDWVAACRAKDVEAITACYAEDVVAYDAILKLHFVGRPAYRKHWENCLAFCAGEMLFEMHEPHIVAGDHVAFCHALTHCGGTGPDGTEQSGWLRMTSCLERRDGKWQIVHEHFSVPFDMESGKALMNLQPDAGEAGQAA